MKSVSSDFARGMDHGFDRRERPSTDRVTERCASHRQEGNQQQEILLELYEGGCSFVNSGAGERIAKHIPDPDSENRLRQSEHNEAPESQPKSDREPHSDPLRQPARTRAQLRPASNPTISPAG